MSTPTPGTWGELPSDQEGSFDRAATPRMSGAICEDSDVDSWGVNPSARPAGWNDQAFTDRTVCSTPIAQQPVVEPMIESIGDSLYGNYEEEKRAISNRRWLNRQDAVIGGSEADTSNNWDATWEQCGLAGGKPARKSGHNGSIHGNDASSVDGNWGRCDSPAEQPASRGNWNRAVYKNEASGPSAHTYQKPAAVPGSWRSSNGDAGPRGPVIHDGGNYGPPSQNTLPKHRDGARFYNASSPPSAPYGPPERKFGSRLNPDNYDGNRAGPDGSRVFYSAILPTVPTLRDIANHAEYTAWFDMLRSILKYHQLAAVIAPDANRPHGYKDGRRWDQDRLRAAIIIKGALSFEVFERVRRNGWRDTENPTETIEKVKETHGAVCPCGHSQGMTLLDF